MSSKPNKINNVMEQIFNVLPKEANLCALPQFFSHDQKWLLFQGSNYADVWAWQNFLLCWFLCRINELTLLITCTCNFLGGRVKGFRWGMEQCSPDYDILCESLHTLFQHADGPVYTKISISILSLNFCEIWVNMSDNTQNC